MKTSYLQYILLLSFIINPLLKNRAIEGLNNSNGYIVVQLCNGHPFALFYLKGVAPPEVATLSIYKGVIPFVIIQLIGLGLVISQPEMGLWLPRLI